MFYPNLGGLKDFYMLVHTCKALQVFNTNYDKKKEIFNLSFKEYINQEIEIYMYIWFLENF